MRIVIIKHHTYLLIPILIIISMLVILAVHPSKQAAPIFDGQRAYTDVSYQLGLGARTMGSAAHEQAVQWIVTSLQQAKWQVDIEEILDANGGNQLVKNIVAKRGTGTPWVILGSHYDSRSYADRDTDPARHTQPVPGANDGASTVAILLELARVIPKNLDKQVWLVFFDAEDNGDSTGKSWSLGANYFVSALQGRPDSVVILDMLGDKDLQVYMERNSNPELNAEVWGVAQELGYTQFIPEYKHSIIDDHLPFIQAGIRAVDIIDIDYPYWHTTHDTLDKISTESLKATGDTILRWLEEYTK